MYKTMPSKWRLLYWRIYFFGTPFCITEFSNNRTIRGYLYRQDAYITKITKPAQPEEREK
jgi:hypothetical protein